MTLAGVSRSSLPGWRSSPTTLRDARRSTVVCGHRRTGLDFDTLRGLVETFDVLHKGVMDSQVID